MPEEVSLMAALDACGRGAPAPSCPQWAPNEFDVRKLVPWNMATSEGQVGLITNQQQQGSLLLLMHFQHCLQMFADESSATQPWYSYRRTGIPMHPLSATMELLVFDAGQVLIGRLR